MKIFKIISVLALMAFLPLFFNGCSEDTTGPVGNPYIASLSDYIANIGDTITIYGEDFGEEGDGLVEFNGTSVPLVGVVSWTPTQIKVVVPNGATSGPVIVERGQEQSNSVNFIVGSKIPPTPENASALSVDANTVKLYWDAPTVNGTNVEDLNNIFANYFIEVYDENQNIVESASAASAPYDIENLTEGEVYTFMIYVVYENGNKSAPPAEVMWSPATRYAGPFKLYESETSQYGSGLDFFNTTENGPKVVKVSEAESWNIGIYTFNDVLKFGSASELEYSAFSTNPPQSADMSEDFWTGGDLDNAFSESALDGVNFGEMALDMLDFFGAADTPGDVIFVFRTMEPGESDYNYVRVLLMYDDANDTFFKGQAPDRYVEVKISYQKEAGVPYAKQPNS